MGRAPYEKNAGSKPAHRKGPYPFFVTRQEKGVRPFYAEAGAASRGRRGGRGLRGRSSLPAPPGPEVSSWPVSASTDCFMSRPETTASAIFDANRRIARSASSL